MYSTLWGLDLSLCPVKRRDTVLNCSVCPSVYPHPGRGPLRNVCGHTYHRTTMIHTFLESPSDLGVHLKIRFSIFDKNFAGIAVQKYTIWLRHAHERIHCVAFAGKLFTLQQLFAYFWKAQPTYMCIPGRNLLFWPKSSKLTSPK